MLQTTTYTMLLTVYKGLLNYSAKIISLTFLHNVIPQESCAAILTTTRYHNENNPTGKTMVTARKAASRDRTHLDHGFILEASVLLF